MLAATSENGQPPRRWGGRTSTMRIDPDTCWRALQARDRRYDGLFFVGVATTGIYCRPVCPARTPGRDRCTFFGCAAEAEQAGFRACFRCRPELAPGQAVVDAIPRLVARAARRIGAGWLDTRSVDELAAGLGVSARHLRRAMEEELGVSPIALAQTRRLAIAKQLLHDSTLPATEIAFASGFSSVRRFNAAFAARFGRSPSAVRSSRQGGEAGSGDGLVLRLDYRPPLDWAALLGFLAARAIPGLEVVELPEPVSGAGARASRPSGGIGGAYRRRVFVGEVDGWIVVTADPTRPTLRVEVPVALARRVVGLAARIRALFDLDARPDVIADQLGGDELLAASVAACPGLRVPGAFDGFEVAVRAVLGQQISVAGATTLSGRLVERFGPEIRASSLAAATVDEVRAIGLPAKRAATLVALAQAVEGGAVDLDDPDDPEATIATLQTLPGIGPWTAQYVAMRALRWPDAFPGGDLFVRRALGPRAEARAAPWRPWRAYAVMHLWNSIPAR